MTTPAPELDLAALHELLKAADLPHPMLMTKAFDHNGDLISTLSDGTGVEARIYVEETADLIEAALNALPALLALVEQQRAEIERLTDKLRLLRDAVDDLTRWEDGEERDSVPVVEIKDVLDGWVPVRLATPAPADATPEAEPAPACAERFGCTTERKAMRLVTHTAACSRASRIETFDPGVMNLWTFDEPAAPAAAGADQGEAQVAAWNAAHPVGTLVFYWRGIRGPEPSGTGRTRSEAWLLGGHTPVVLIHGTSGGIALTHVQVIDESAPGAADDPTGAGERP